MGALTTIVVPWLVDRMDTTSWEAMAWWIHDNLPYSELQFFPKLFAFNIGWHQAPKRTIYSFIRVAFSRNRDSRTTIAITVIATKVSRS